ncbi:D-alanyl-D-alanine dipeptidase [Actinorhabdospora filicis]|uniref:D-alanyl-D-alanine dipeptidase n=1 Tax=Actinorhabdospora filicis TaxID=1785913 RepID=A0A9W6W889_9ACTN|nr:M15 family metallopeptidase [Actinorhabdospora filicis]GLZ77344.1 D-alanyl-D-alanine dipeptidase [Actinorhabdospora filicis]
MILLSDPRVAAVPSRDNGEAMVDLREVPEIRLDGRYADPDGWYARIREAVLDKLLRAQAMLPDGMRLLITEAYRPPALQRKYFEGYKDKLRAANPGWDEALLHVEASKFVSPPEVAPHGTGGTVDLTLCTPDGVELDMGTAVDASPVDSRNRCFTASPDVIGEARRNRDALSKVLLGVGMVNYPTEWWHWSYGDRYWALSLNATHTRYGPVEL